MTISKTQRDLLMLEYQILHDGHKSRDESIPREFGYMLHAFVIFLTLLGATQVFLRFDRAFAIVIFIVIGLTGLICLLTFLIDIQSNTSCKRAIRKRAAEIEEILGIENLSYWKTLRKREMYMLEYLLKGRADGPVLPSAAVGFVIAGKMLVLFWVIAVVLIIVWGEAVKLV